MNPPTAGRGKGQPNFKSEEDVILSSSAYGIVATNASIGKDQKGATFWGKIQELFVQHGGNAGHTACSLQNRFNKTLQMEVNKYIGMMLMGSLNEYHSGLVLEDYINDAKCKEEVCCKIFKNFQA
jgi:hypothetical protein